MERPDNLVNFERAPIRDRPFERSLPNSSEAERTILGAVILDNGLIAQAVEMLVAEDFYVPSHRRIFVAMVALFGRGEELNPILIGEELKKENALETVGGISFITNLTFGVYHHLNIESEAKIVHGKSLLRRLIKTASKITNEALEEEDSAEHILDSAEAQIFALSDDRVRGGRFESVKPIAVELLDKIQDMEGRGVALTGVTTGFTDLDQLTSGWQKQDLIIVAARPSMGKTAFALMLAQNAGMDNESVIGIFSLEMSKPALVMRLLCAQGNIDAHRFRNGFLSRAEWAQTAKSLGVVCDQKIFIDDTPAINVLEMRAKAMRLKAEQKRLDLIVVDYLQLMDGAKKTESRQQEVSQISRNLKALAKEIDVPLVALSQLSRAPENRSNHRPQLSDLRESGAIEQDADLVAFIYREEEYKSMEERQAMPDDRRGVAEIIVAKQRNGPTATVELRWVASSMRFDNLYRDQKELPRDWHPT